MIFIPISTDAPIYHFPFGTIALIVTNVVIFFATGADLYDAIDAYGLHHGSGFTPIQWVTSNFIHRGFFHLLGNMIFLWGFGIIVEGKIGWLQFVPLYLSIGVLECLLEQAIFGYSGGVSFGASAIIYGLMVISLIWAPQNEFTVFLWLFIRFWIFDISVVAFAILNLMISFAMMSLMYLVGSPINSELLHLLGAGVGGVFGIAYLKLKFVDCEGWDIISVMTGNTPNSEAYLSSSYQEASRRRRNTTKAKRQRPFIPDPKNQLGKASPERFSKYLDANKLTAAFAEFERIRHRHPEWSPQPKQLLKLARGLRTASEMEKSVKAYREFVEAEPKFTLASLELAEIFVYVQERPSAAMRLLNRCEVETFSEKQQQRHQQATHHSQRMIDDGIIEIDLQL
jgi:membrane associated rhomboid family serine protease